MWSCLSSAGIKNHQRYHKWKEVIYYMLHGISTCSECGKECDSVVGLKHMKVHQNISVKPTVKDKQNCHISTWKFKALAGAKNHRFSLLKQINQTLALLKLELPPSYHCLYILSTFPNLFFIVKVTDFGIWLICFASHSSTII